MSPLGQAQLVGGAQAVAQSNVNTKTIAAIAVPLPPIHEQQLVVAALDNSFVGSDAVLEQCFTLDSDLTQLDQSILAKAFRGELVPQDPNDEPASVLLQRIRREREEAQANSRARNGKRRMKRESNQ